MSTINVDTGSIRDMARAMSERAGDIDASCSLPALEGTSQVLDEYGEVLAELGELVDKYRDLVFHDARLIESIVAEMARVDQGLAGGGGGPRMMRV